MTEESPGSMMEEQILRDSSKIKYKTKSIEDLIANHDGGISKVHDGGTNYPGQQQDQIQDETHQRSHSQP